MTQFRERNPVPIALAGLLALVIVIVVAFDAGNLSFIPGGGGTVYHAAFEDASNIQVNDDVRIAGIKIGHVTKVSLRDGHVDVAMKVEPGTPLSPDTRAAIRIKTLLGAMYVALSPGTAPGKLDPHSEIVGDPTPLIVTTAFEGLATRIEAIDVNSLEQAFNALSGDFQNTPSEVSSTLRGLAAVSQTISSRDTQLQALLGHAQGVTTALASRDAEVTLLINDGQTVLNLVTQQRDIIHMLLINTSILAGQITALVRENTGILTPALVNLQSTVDILTKDQANLDEGIYLLAPFVRDFTNTLGNGEWFDTYIQNLSDLGNPGCFTAVATLGGSNVPVKQSGSGACA